MTDIIIGVITFWLCLLAMIAILYFFPDLALWLPGYLFAPL